jgi:hypothetical protein
LGIPQNVLPELFQQMSEQSCDVPRVITTAMMDPLQGKPRDLQSLRHAHLPPQCIMLGEQLSEILVLFAERIFDVKADILLNEHVPVIVSSWNNIFWVSVVREQMPISIISLYSPEGGGCFPSTSPQHRQ